MDEATRKKAWRGWCMYDWANSAFATVIMAAVLPVYFAALVPSGGGRISILGWERTLSAPSLWGYGASFSMLLVALSAPYLGALADRRGCRRQLLIAFCLFGATATSLLFFADDHKYILALVLFIVANYGFAVGNIFYNAFLPALAREAEIDRLSARGFAYGYIGGGLMLLIAFVLILNHDFFGLPDRGAATRLSFLLTGLWWAAFSIPTFLHVREDVFVRTPLTLPMGIRGYLRTFAEIRHYRDLLLFLIAFLFYNDGIQTIILVAAIFGREELGLSEGTILGAFLMIQFTAMPGALLFGRLAEKWGARNAIFLSLVLFVGVTAFAYFMQSSVEFWILGFVVALILGGSQSISRSLFASFIPPGKNAEFFGFYTISGKFASIMGPFVFALIADLTGSNRLSILAVSFFFVVGMIFLGRVNVERARAAARTAS